MQQIYKQKNMCTGCGACANACPTQCVSMLADEQGFLYPVVNQEKCISCGACQKVCHNYIDKFTSSPQLFAFIHSDPHILSLSSSGGAFSHIASQVLNQGGYVAGAVFDTPDKVKHIVSNKPEDLAKMRGSKYVQSETGDCFLVIQKLLQTGEKVLFSGTPCQAIGLKTFLKREYDSLITVDCICHSVPSPLIYGEYIKTLTLKYNQILELSFRDKRNGWLEYGLSLKGNDKETFIPRNESLYMRGFLAGLYSRDCCNDCPAKDRVGYRSDITLGDFWGVQQLLPETAYNNGVSAVIINHPKGFEYFDKAELIPVDLNAFVAFNPKYRESDQPDGNREEFWRVYHKKGLLAAFDVFYKPTFWKKIKNKIKYAIQCRKK